MPLFVLRDPNNPTVGVFVEPAGSLPYNLDGLSPVGVFNAHSVSAPSDELLVITDDGPEPTPVPVLSNLILTGGDGLINAEVQTDVASGQLVLSLSGGISSIPDLVITNPLVDPDVNEFFGLDGLEADTYTVTVTQLGVSISGTVVVTEAPPAPTPTITISNGTFTAPTESVIGQLMLSATYVASNPVALEARIIAVPTDATVTDENIDAGNGPTIEAFTADYVDGVPVTVQGAPGTDESLVGEFHVIVREKTGSVRSTGFRIPGVNLVVGAPPPPPAASTDVFQHTDAVPGIETPVYTEGGFTVFCRFKPVGTSTMELVTEADNTNNLNVTVDPHTGKTRVRAKGNGSNNVVTIDGPNPNPAVPMPLDGDGFVNLILSFRPGDLRVDQYVNGVAFDPNNEFFGNTVWTGTASDVRTRRHRLVGAAGFGRAAEINEWSWWNTPVTAGVVPTAEPGLKLLASPTGAFVSASGGNFDIYDDGVVRAV